MENPQQLKKRLKSVANISKITKAMELVAATKMRKSQEIALASRPYAFMALDLLANVSDLVTDAPALLQTHKEIKNTLFVLAASDKGLAGAFNNAIFRKFENYILQHPKKDNHLFVAVGEKTAAYLTRKGFGMVKKFVHVGDFTTPEQVRPLSDFLAAGYVSGQWDKVVIFSNHFYSALQQVQLQREILPLTFESIKETLEAIIPERGRFAELIKEHELHFIPERKGRHDYIMEPSAKKILEKLTRHLFAMQIYHIILEANAAEHSARRLAMKTASDNALDLSEKLQLQYNKSRQALITKEIIEISAGAEALN